MTPAKARQLVDDLRSGAEVKPTRGARVCTWRQAERVLAGFPDGRADEGVTAGEASVVGLRLAESRGWAAPAGGDGTPPAMTTQPETPAAATEAAREADTKRAESESQIAEVDAGHDAGHDAGKDAAKGDADSKGNDATKGNDGTKGNRAGKGTGAGKGNGATNGDAGKRKR
jgi:NADH-quinone oxidoreductase subunit E